MSRATHKTTILPVMLWAALIGSAYGQIPSVTHGDEPVAMDYHAIGEWSVSAAGRMVVVTLECTAFTNQTDGRTVADTTLRLTPRGLSGGAAGSVLVSQDRTDLENNHSVARVSAAVSGQGVASFQLEASIDSQEFHAAGNYKTTVAATLSAP